MTVKVFVIEASTFVRLPDGTDLERIAAEHGGDLVGHFPDCEVVSTSVHDIRPATPEELAGLAEELAGLGS
jgi:hypothetical protein